MSGPNRVHKSKRLRLHTRERRTLLVLGDFLMAVIAMLIALWFWASGEIFQEFSIEFLLQRPPAWYYLLPFFWVILLVELYDIHRAGDWGDTVRGVAIATLIGLGFYLSPTAKRCGRILCCRTCAYTDLAILVYSYIYCTDAHAPGIISWGRESWGDIIAGDC
jgi:hypothetical protein